MIQNTLHKSLSSVYNELWRLNNNLIHIQQSKFVMMLVISEKLTNKKKNVFY